MQDDRAAGPVRPVDRGKVGIEGSVGDRAGVRALAGRLVGFGGTLVRLAGAWLVRPCFGLDGSRYGLGVG
ncbi:MAG TPA: hypothetical protein VGM28_05590 [Candidatus Limnocylindrales bacterium]